MVYTEEQNPESKCICILDTYQVTLICFPECWQLSYAFHQWVRDAPPCLLTLLIQLVKIFGSLKDVNWHVTVGLIYICPITDEIEYLFSVC